MTLLRALFWGLASLVIAFLAWRLLKLTIWALMRPGGWVVIAVLVLVAVKAMDGGAAQAVVP